MDCNNIYFCTSYTLFLATYNNKKTKEIYSKAKARTKRNTKRINSHTKKVDFETQKLYFQARNLFNTLMKEGRLSHNEIVYLDRLVQRLLGEFVHHYDNFTFENTCHRIYTMLKSSHLDKHDFQEIIDYLKECEIRTKDELKEEQKWMKKNYYH